MYWAHGSNRTLGDQSQYIYVELYIHTHYTVMVDVTSASQTWLDCFLHFFKQDLLCLPPELSRATLDVNLRCATPPWRISLGDDGTLWLWIDREKEIPSISKGDEDP